ncbi:uncharacterized protein LOC135385578 [Ornithodoros turicata]|uniref:uncharacterized protein LOC135385578 n=1 Tax=Ornithodoros turicata TaxID=34597 RepID=UPI00313995DF
MGFLRRTYVLLLTICTLARSDTEVEYDVTCSSKMMRVDVKVNNSNSILYLEKLKGYPHCQPDLSEGKAHFSLELDNIYNCGTTRMHNKLTGQRIYYHRIFIETPGEETQVILAKCVLPGGFNQTHTSSGRSRRQADLPFDLVEPEHLNITEYIEARAPVPYLDLAIRQNGRILDTTLNVQPGTPLEMLIFLDSKSKDTYGILASYLKVTDSTPNQEEIIVMNGCSIDPYIFGNFETLDGGDTLSAKFRAFKFPESNYVLFVGTVNICIKECKGIPCGNGQYGYGRRKRAIPSELPKDPNKVFEVELTTFLKVEYKDDLFTLRKGAIAGEFDGRDVNQLPLKQTAAESEDVIVISESSMASSSTLSTVLFAITLFALALRA